MHSHAVFLHGWRLAVAERLSLRLPVAPRSAWVLGLLMLVLAVLGHTLKPQTRFVQNPPDLERAIPRSFGDWQEVNIPFVQIDVSVKSPNEAVEDQPYDQVVTRTYAQPGTNPVMLSVAYINAQQQEVKVHRPPLCYVAQGFKVGDESHGELAALGAPNNPVRISRMLATSGSRQEAVVYLIRTGGLHSADPWQVRWYILQQGVKGYVPDGALVRASTLIHQPSEAPQAYQRLERFMVDLVHATPSPARNLLVHPAVGAS